MKASRRKKKRNSSKRAGNRWFRPIALVFHSLVASLNVFLLMLLVVAAYSDRISPLKSTIFAYLGLAFPVIVFINICFLVYWLVVRKWFLVAVSVVVAAFCWGPLGNYCPIHLKKEIPQEGGAIKVLSYNVMAFAYAPHTKDTPNKIIEYIAGSGADIVCLQEYMTNAKGGLMTSKDVMKALNMYPYVSEIFYKDEKGVNHGYGIAVFSKFPIKKSKRIFYTSHYNGSSIHEIDMAGKKLVLVNNHLESFKLTVKDRSMYSNMFTHASIDAFNELRHAVQPKLGEAFRVRAKQAEAVAREIKEAKGDYTLVCGDFNDTPISYCHRTMRGDLVDAFSASGSGIGVSYNQSFFFFRIDNILHSANMKPYHCVVDRSVKYSDHYPISCYLKLE